MVSARGRMWTAAREVAVDYARRPREELVETLRRLAGSRRKPQLLKRLSRSSALWSAWFW